MFPRLRPDIFPVTDSKVEKAKEVKVKKDDRRYTIFRADETDSDTAVVQMRIICAPPNKLPQSKIRYRF